MKPRLIALIGFALMLANLSAHARATAPEVMDHISIAMIGTKGSPLILIPGLATPRAVWDGIAPELAKSHRVYLVEVNGFGGGDPGANLKPGILDGMVADLHGFIVAHKLQGAAVVGHSLGGLAGLMLAKAHPADVGKLMVVDALPYVGDTFLPGATVAQVEPQAARIRDATAAAYGKPMAPASAEATAAGMALKPGSRARIATWVAVADPRVSALALYDDLTTDLRPDMAAIATPITLIYPWSEALPKTRADEFYHAEYAKAPHVTYVDVGESGHFVMLDQPEAFAAAVKAFLAAG